MVVETTNRKQNFAGGQSVLTFTFRALVDHPEDISLIATSTSTGAIHTFTYITDYTVSVDADGVGGTVTVSPTVSTSNFYTVFRETTVTQQSDYDDFNQFPANTLEENLDQAIMISQELAEGLARSLLLPISTTASTITFPSPDANKIIGWNSAGTDLENKSVVSLGTATLASTAEAQAATNNTNYMTPFLVKTEVEFPGAVLIPAANLVLSGGSAASFSTINVTTATITNITASTILATTINATNVASTTATFGSITVTTTATITTVTASTVNTGVFRVGATNQGDILYDNGTSFVRLTPSTSGFLLRTNGAGANPSWAPTTSTSGPLSLVVTSSFTSVKSTSAIPISANKIYNIRFNITTDDTTGDERFNLRFNSNVGTNYQTTQGVSSGTIGTSIVMSAASDDTNNPAWGEFYINTFHRTHAHASLTGSAISIHGGNINYVSAADQFVNNAFAGVFVTTTASSFNIGGEGNMQINGVVYVYEIATS